MPRTGRRRGLRTPRCPRRGIGHRLIGRGLDVGTRAGLLGRPVRCGIRGWPAPGCTAGQDQEQCQQQPNHHTGAESGEGCVGTQPANPPTVAPSVPIQSSCCHQRSPRTCLSPSIYDDTSTSRRVQHAVRGSVALATSGPYTVGVTADVFLSHPKSARNAKKAAPSGVSSRTEDCRT